jgi:hypothetical protein
MNDDIVIELPGGQEIEFPYGTSPEIIKAQSAKVFSSLIDREAGAPAKVRMAVGNARTPEDKLSTLRNYYPDSFEHGEDGLVFIDPKTNTPTLYNPEGADWGDVPEYGRQIAQTIGAVPGAALGTPAGPLGATGGAALGAEAGGQMYDLLMQNVYDQADTRSGTGRVIDAATEVVGMMGAEGALKTVPTAAKWMFGASGKAGKKALSTLDDYIELQINKPFAGDVTGNPVTQRMQHALSYLPGSARYSKRAADETIGDMSQALAKLSKRAGTSETAGKTLQGGIEKYAGRFKTHTDHLYEIADRWVDDETKVIASNTAAAVQSVMNKFGSELPGTAGKLTPSLFKTIAEDLAKLGDGTISYSAMKNLRSEVGKRIGDPSLVDDIGRADLKKLYASLSDDMRAALPNEAARKSWARASSAYEKGLTLIETTLSKLARKGLEAGDAYAFAARQGRNGGDYLQNLRRGLKREEWDVFTSTFLRQMGDAKAGAQDAAGEVFSPNTFVTNWNKLAPEAKKALFSGGRWNKGMWKDLDALVNISAGAKETTKLGNASGTAPMAKYIEMAAGFGGFGMGAFGNLENAASLVSAGVLGMFGSNMSARMLTSPAIIKWLVTPVAKNGVSAHLGRLGGIIAEEPLLEPLAKEITELVEKANERNGYSEN